MPSDPLLTHAPAHVLPQLLEVRAVAHRLSVSPEYVRDLIRDGKLAGIRFGRYWRIDAREVHEFLERHRVATTGGG